MDAAQHDASTWERDATRSAIAGPTLRHRVMGGFIGNVVEWYDSALYGYLAGVIAPVFFPEGNPTAALIATYGIFAAGFLMRPLGDDGARDPGHAAARGRR